MLLGFRSPLQGMLLFSAGQQKLLVGVSDAFGLVL